MHDVSVSMQSSVLKSASSSSPNGQLERAGATGAGQGRAAEGRTGVVSQSYKQWVQWNTEVEGVGGCAPRLDALGPSPIQWGLGGQNRRRERAQEGREERTQSLLGAWIGGSRKFCTN